MKIVTNYLDCNADFQNAAVALGNFDGIHKGHQAIIEGTKIVANEHNLPSAIMTFEPHPRKVFRPDSEDFLINSLDDKIALIEKQGIDILYLVKFDEDFAKISARDFITDILLQKLSAKYIITGENFIFGCGRKGNTELITDLASEFGFGYKKIPNMGNDNEKFSSSAIRELIREGKVDLIPNILGRHFSIHSKVIKGNQKGTEIGFPTANIKISDIVKPKKGVYAVKVSLEESGHKEYYNAIANFGTRPTLDGENEFLEVHIFDFNHNIYGRKITVELLNYIRNEQRFKGIDSLKSQIKKDIDIAYNYFNSKNVKVS